MKASELRKLSIDELKKKELELKENLFRLRFKLATGDLENTAQIRETRKDIARIKTILREYELEGQNGK
ncbi:50S ribosomal protein L29 [Deferribacter desulfuricans SSM1]|uniref:Large ribosomal subunit protein uL29 n=1 Tax=Deferribacter desulfuricans (strain DSM 14783 / JCM 11476 / NBRC 101012 / SSM1) TaxID=639282 RepID=D3P929_DEFDS|nr:50S ribosomal protein L29 [Deferribacter desulfuricans]BAI81219.1 50S ribosomal protein L29 [Deferribacter desulfuricans SSM1]